VKSAKNRYKSQKVRKNAENRHKNKKN